MSSSLGFLGCFAMAPNRFGFESVDLKTGHRVKFHWERSAITQRLISAVGVITLEWAMIDPEVTNMVQTFWLTDRPSEKIPRSFDKRSDILKDYTDTLYASDKDEWLVFRWFLQRLKMANGNRDAIAHGLPGTITQHGRTYKGLMVPFPSKETGFVPMSTDAIVELADTLIALNAEARQVSRALWNAHWRAQAASLRDIVSQQPDGKITLRQAQDEVRRHVLNTPHTEASC